MRNRPPASLRHPASRSGDRLLGAPAGACRLHVLLLAAAAIVAPGSSLAAQDAEAATGITLEGEVLDVASGVPVAVAIVAIPALNRSAVTDELGYFRFEGIPAGFYPIRVMRLGYETLAAEVPVNGREVLAFHLTPGPVSLDGIEVVVKGQRDIETAARGTSSRGIIGPAEMDELRERYFSLDQILTGRYMPRARFRPGREPGDPGCLMATALRLSGRSCATVVVDGVLIGRDWSDWVYRMSTDEIFSVRFQHGPAAALRYGHRGSDGVLFIETRTGR